MDSNLDTLAAPNAYARASVTAKYVRSQLPEALQNPKVAIVCGSGLGGLADTIEPEPKVELAYGTIPNFPQSTGECNMRPWILPSGCRVLMIPLISCGTCWQVCVRSDWAPEDSCSAACWTSTVSHRITRHCTML